MRMLARRRKASDIRVRFSKSLASLRQRPIQANVRSTIHRFGSTTKPFAWSDRLTICSLQPPMAATAAAVATP